MKPTDVAGRERGVVRRPAVLGLIYNPALGHRVPVRIHSGAASVTGAQVDHWGLAPHRPDAWRENAGGAVASPDTAGKDAPPLAGAR